MLADSNILVYAINTSSPKHKRAQEFLKENIGKFVIAHQNIFETLRVLTHPKFPKPMKSDGAIEAINRIVAAGYVIFPDYKTSHIALELVKSHNLFGDQVFDAYLVVTALSNNETIIATDNTKDFKKFSQIKVLNPFSENLRS